MEYINYNPQGFKEPEATQPEPVNEIDNALSIMQSVQCTNKEPESYSTRARPVKEPEPEPQEPVKEPEATVPEPEPTAKEYVNFAHSSTFFKRIFKMLSTVNSEAKIYFNSEKIETSIADPAHVLMLSLEIPKNAIESYQTKEDMSLGFDLYKMNYILQNSNKNDGFEFLYDSNKDLFKSFIKNGLFNHTYHMIDKEALPEPKIPELNLPVTVKLDTKLFHDFLVQAEKLSDYIEIIATKDNLTLFAIGNTDEVKIVLSRDQLKLFQCDSNYQSKFSVDYLLSIVKQIKTLFNEITLNIGSDNPLKIIGDNGYKATVLLAPRIGSE